ncbi:hypothetical protein L3V82_09610 [Thiotrichales bacterium 19S3-7]|nr:hypothetical protein [Thiotrichales bacterium 19S3-7]MCF6802414.1 hypothetical protein [Thiotrichales bacterium 19S3-11]
MKFVAMVTRTLKEGKTYDDYRKAWFHTTGFGIPTTMYTIINAFNPREIISIGILDGELIDLYSALEIDVKDRLSNPLDDVIESTIVRNFGVVAAIDDFSPKGELTYIPAAVDGKPTDYNAMSVVLEQIAAEIKKASHKRDQLKKSNN